MVDCSHANSGSDHTRQALVWRDVLGQRLAGQTAITDVGLTVGAVSTAYSDTVAAGNVISQEPVADTSVSVGAAVDLVVSLGILQDKERLEKDQSTNNISMFAQIVMAACDDN